jgi:hypothetical protein
MDNGVTTGQGTTEVGASSPLNGDLVANKIQIVESLQVEEVETLEVAVDELLQEVEAPPLEEQGVIY